MGVWTMVDEPGLTRNPARSDKRGQLWSRVMGGGPGEPVHNTGSIPLWILLAKDAVRVSM